MLFKENVILALRSLKSNKMRAFLTMLGIIIGVSAVIAILTVGNSITKNVTSMMNGLGANDVFIAVQEKKNSTETEDEIKALKVDGLNFGKSSSSTKMQQSDYITTEMIYSMCEEFKDEIYAVNIYDQLGNADVAYEGKKAKNSVVGTSVGFYLSNSVDVVEGTMFSPSDFDEGKYTCLIPTYTAKRLFGKNYKDAIGQEITAETSYGDVLLTVIGVYKTNGRNGMMMQMGTSIHSTYVPLKTAMALDHSSGQYSFFQVSAKDGINPNSLKGKVKSFLEPYFRNNARYTVAVVTYENILNMFYKLLGMITLAISIIAGIALLVGGIGVMNIMLVSVTERTREIGTRKALGARNSSIRAQFIVEAVIICLIGGIIGVVFGILMGNVASYFLGYPADPSILGIVISLGVSSAVGLFFGYFPANKAARLNPIEALRYE